MKKLKDKKTLVDFLPPANATCYLQIYAYLKSVQDAIKKDSITLPEEDYRKIWSSLRVLHRKGFIRSEAYWQIASIMTSEFFQSDGFGKWYMSEKIKGENPAHRQFIFPAKKIPIDVEQFQQQYFSEAGGTNLALGFDSPPKFFGLTDAIYKKTRTGNRRDHALDFLVHALVYDLRLYAEKDLKAMGAVCAVVADFLNDRDDIDKPPTRDKKNKGGASAFERKNIENRYRNVSQDDIILYSNYLINMDLERFKKTIQKVPKGGFLTLLTKFAEGDRKSRLLHGLCGPHLFDQFASP